MAEKQQRSDDCQYQLIHLQGTSFVLQTSVELFRLVNANLMDEKYTRLALLDCLYRSFVRATERNTSDNDLTIVVPTSTKYVRNRPNLSFSESTKNVVIVFEVACQNSLDYIQKSLQGIMLQIIDDWVLCSKDVNNEVSAMSKSLEDQYVLRKLVAEARGVSFIENGSKLVNIAGDGERGRDSGDCSASSACSASPPVVPFQSPVSLQVEFDLPYRGKVQGLLIPRGVTVIVGKYGTGYMSVQV